MITGPFHDHTLAGSRALTFILREYADLLEAGYGELEISFHNISHVCYFLDGAEVVAATVWAYDAPNLMGWTYFTAVKATHRGQGLYNRISDEVEARMKALGATTSCSSMSVNNLIAIEASEKRGKKGISYRVRKKLG